MQPPLCSILPQRAQPMKRHTFDTLQNKFAVYLCIYIIIMYIFPFVANRLCQMPCLNFCVWNLLHRFYAIAAPLLLQMHRCIGYHLSTATNPYILKDYFCSQNRQKQWKGLDKDKTVFSWVSLFIATRRTHRSIRQKDVWPCIRFLTVPTPKIFPRTLDIPPAFSWGVVRKNFSL